MADTPIKVISPSDLGRIQRAVRWVEQQPRGRNRREAAIPIGVESCPIFSTAGHDCPVGGLIWTPVMAADQVRYVGKRPEYPGISKFLIAASAIAHGENGRGWGPSSIPRAVRVDDWANTDVGDCLMPWFDQFDAHLMDGGPMRVIEKLDTPCVKVIYHGRRTGAINMLLYRWGYLWPAAKYNRTHTLILDGRLRGSEYAGRTVVITAAAPGTPSPPVPTPTPEVTSS